MSAPRDGLASVSLGSTKEIGLRLIAQGRFENLSEACRAGLRRLEEDARVVDRLIALGEEGMVSGVDETFAVSTTKFTPDTFGGTVSSIYDAGILSSGDDRITVPASVTVPANSSTTMTVTVNAAHDDVVQGWINLDPVETTPAGTASPKTWVSRSISPKLAPP